MRGLWYKAAGPHLFLDQKHPELQIELEEKTWRKKRVQTFDSKNKLHGSDRFVCVLRSTAPEIHQEQSALAVAWSNVTLQDAPL